MANFFNALANLANEDKSIRILHYGDSQIEGDRISDYLRLKLQGQFGGEGPGLISFMPVAPSVVNKISWSPGWDRYPVFAGRDKRVKHNNFGALAHITRFHSYSTITDTTPYTSAWVKVVTSKNGGPKAAAYKKIKLFYGGAQTKTQVELYENGTLNTTDSLAAGGNFNIKEFNLNQGALLQEFKFRGKDSPDFYGLSLEGGKGVMVDNFGLRGSSGTFFNQINYGQLKSFYDYLNTKLIILQFGGNSLPYIKTKEQAVGFGGYLKSQIATIKKMAPQASILVIGPADMSVKDGADYVTHPQLENLRDAIRQTAFDMDCAFFDMYSCMGGKNSMVSWVEQGIGAKDYIHFSSGGARKIAVLLYASLMNDYNNYSKNKK
jgi:lysophospholipase L1-like esterase